MDTTNAAVATTAPKTADELAKELFDKVQTEKASIAQAEKPNWETNGQFRFSAESPQGAVSIFTCNDIRKLVEIQAFLIGRERDFKEAATLHGVDVRFTWLSQYASDWQKDIKTRIDQLQLSEKKKKLAVLEERLARLLTPEQQKALELAAIQKEMGL